MWLWRKWYTRQIKDLVPLGVWVRVPPAAQSTLIKNKLNNMKNWNWKQWTAFGLVVAVIIVGVILHLVQPEVSYALLEMVSGGTFVLGGFATWLFMKGKTPIQINS